MYIIVFTGILCAALWFVTTVWLDKYRVFGVLTAPLVTVGLIQYGNYQMLGYLDPFILIAIVVQLAICLVTVSVLEVIRKSGGEQLRQKLSRNRKGLALTTLGITLLFALPLLDDMKKNMRWNRQLDAVMQEKAETKARSIISSRVENIPTVTIRTEYDRSHQLYRTTFSAEDKPWAIVVLDGVTLDEKSVTFPDREVPK